MKKSILMLSCAAGILMFSACNKENVSPQSSNDSVSIDTQMTKTNEVTVIAGKWDGVMGGSDICCDPGDVCYIQVTHTASQYAPDPNNPDGIEDMNVALDDDGNAGNTIYGRVVQTIVTNDQTVYKFGS